MDLLGWRKGKQKVSTPSPRIQDGGPSSTSRQPFPSGIKVLYDSADSKVDIVFVHGLGGDRESSWKTEDATVPWPQSLLPVEVPWARILTFGYDAYVADASGDVSMNRIGDHARNFLNSIALHRERDDSNERPLIFVAHCLGGLLCEDALVISSQSPDDHLNRVYHSTCGIAFLGTPHSGSDLEAWAEKLSQALNTSRHANLDIVSVLRRDSEVLARIQSSFHSLMRVRGLKITCFFEELPTPGGDIIVPSYSAVLPSYNHIGIRSNHMEMTKFRSNDDPGFVAVAGELRRWIKSVTAQSRQAPRINSAQIEQLMTSLRFPQMDSRKATISNAHTRTCHWLSSSPEYISWLDDTRLHDHNGFLWIKGKAGAGKSTLMKYALMQTNYSLDGTIVLSFFFNARGDHLEKSTIGAYRSLLHELLKKIPSLKKVFQALDPMPQHIEFSHYQWTLANLEHFLCKAIQQLLVEQKRVICFIDALDECDESDIRSMISFLQNLSTDQFRVCFASRPYPIITMRKCLDLDLDMQGGHRDDIIVYLQNQLNIGYSQEAESLRNMMQSMSSGIFLWVCLVVPMLNSAYDRGKSLRVLRRKLHEIPKDLHSLFLSIVQRDKEDKEQLLLVIQWVLFAARPLRPRELYYAMLHQLEPEDFEELMGATLGEHHSKSEYTYILAASKGLVQLTQSDDPVVQFIHESVKEFLINDGGLANIWPGPSGGIIGENHEQLKRSCLHYFLNFPPNHIQLAIRSLRQYAVENVLYHAEAAQSGGIDQEEFLRLFPIERFRNSDDEEEPAHALYILASRNYVNLIRALPSNSVSSGNFEMIDGTKWGSPFLLATAHGFQQVTRAFLEASVLNQNPDRILDFYKRCSGNDDGQWESHKDGSWLQSNPSLWLERLSNHQLAEALLEGRGIDYQSPLFAKNMALACILHDFAPRDIEVLLWSGKKESRGKGRWASLKYAIRQKATRVVRLLLSVQNMDVNERDESGFTSLMEAAEDDSDGEIIKILLKSEKIRVHVNLQNSLGRTALVIAAIHSSLEGFKALVALHNANINLQDKAGMTPLAMACIARDIGKMDLLLQRGEIDVNLPDWMGRAPLHWAITNEARTRLLLQTGRVIVEKRDFYGATLLWCAVARKNLAVVKLLLEMGQVDVNCRGRARVFNRPRGKTLIVYSPPGPKDPSAQVLTEAVTPLRMAMKSRMECPALFDLLVEYARQQGKKQLLRA